MGTALESVYLPPNRVTCVPAYESILVATINDPGINPVVVTINGVIYSTADASLTLIVRGTNIVWTGAIDLSNAGLSNNTRYSWAANQGANSDDGSYYHTPAKYTNHRLHFVSCDNNEGFTSEVTGHWKYMREQFEAGKEISGMVLTDDDGYADGINIKDDGSVYLFPNMSGLASGGRPTSTAALDDYLISWCAILGMLGPEQTVYSDADLAAGSSTRSLRQALWGREINRAICRKNINKIHGGQSDHDFIDDMGWKIKRTFGNHYANGKLAYDAFYGLVSPKISKLIAPVDIAAGHWVGEFGDVSLGSLDYVTNADRSTWINGDEPVNYGDSTQLTQFTTIFGDDQIDDYLKAVNAADATFHIMCTQFSVRYLIARTGSVPPNAFTEQASLRSHGAQHPLYDHCLADYARLFTEAGNPVKSIMDNPKTNGKEGAFLMVGGDLHLAQAISCNHPAYAGNLAEDFWHINIATVNNSGLTGSVGVTGDEIANAKIEFAEAVNVFDEYYGFYIDVKGMNSPPSIETVLVNKENKIILHKQFMKIRGGNSGYDMSIDLQNKSIGILSSNN